LVNSSNIRLSGSFVIRRGRFFCKDGLFCCEEKYLQEKTLKEVIVEAERTAQTLEISAEESKRIHEGVPVEA
jgi:hypothetical protein